MVVVVGGVEEEEGEVLLLQDVKMKQLKETTR